LASHAGNDVANAAPVVEASVKSTQFWLAWLKTEEAQGRAENAGTGVSRGHVSELYFPCSFGGPISSCHSPKHSASNTNVSAAKAMSNSGLPREIDRPQEAQSLGVVL